MTASQPLIQEPSPIPSSKLIPLLDPAALTRLALEEVLGWIGVALVSQDPAVWEGEKPDGGAGILRSHITESDHAADLLLDAVVRRKWSYSQDYSPLDGRYRCDVWDPNSTDHACEWVGEADSRPVAIVQAVLRAVRGEKRVQTANPFEERGARTWSRE